MSRPGNTKEEGLRKILRNYGDTFDEPNLARCAIIDNCDENLLKLLASEGLTCNVLGEYYCVPEFPKCLAAYLALYRKVIDSLFDPSFILSYRS